MKVMVDHALNHGPLTVVTLQDVSRGRRGCCVCCCAYEHAVTLGTSMSEAWPMTLIEEKRLCANVEQEGRASTETSDLEAVS